MITNVFVIWISVKTTYKFRLVAMVRPYGGLVYKYKCCLLSSLSYFDIKRKNFSVERIYKPMLRKPKMLHFDNPFQDYSADAAADILSGNGLNKSHRIVTKLEEKWQDTLKRFENLDFNDYTVYTGTSGVALLKLLKEPNDPSNLNEIRQLLSLDKLKNRRHTFLCGDAGPLAIGAVVCDKLGDHRHSQKLIDKLLALKDAAIDTKSDLPSEYLYGRAGYLYALAFVNRHIKPAPIEDELFRSIIEAILIIGQNEAKNGNFKTPLMYEWHESNYLGAAHGISGIMYILLQLRQHLTDVELNTLIKPTLEYLISVRFPNGNYPAALGSKTDKVQWCHGAPGFVFLFTLAYKVFKDRKYLLLATDAGDIVWHKGLTRKGYSICHGVSGNGYCFLDLYQTTKEMKYLYRAAKFAEWCMDYTREHEEHSPDRPLSLFEGIAGPMYYLIDIQKPMEAKFPGFTI